MTELIDFNDGRGAVPAERHANGGGYVATSASVCNASYVGRNAIVAGFAKVRKSTIKDSARIIVHAQVINCEIGGEVEIRGHSVVTDLNLCGNERITQSLNPDLTGNPRDVAGRELKSGQMVARAWRGPQGANGDLEICTVTRVDGTKVWLDDSKSPIKRPDRLAIIG